MKIYTKERTIRDIIRNAVNESVIGTTKDLRDGREIYFTRKNQTNTYSALKNYLVGIEKKSPNRFKEFSSDDMIGIDEKIYWWQARTGSSYLRFILDGIFYDIRFSNHTKPNADYDTTNPISVGFEDGKIIDADIDMSQSDFKIVDIKKIFTEINNINRSDIDDIGESNFPILSQYGIIDDFLYENQRGKKYEDMQELTKYSSYFDKIKKNLKDSYFTDDGIYEIKTNNNISPFWWEVYKNGERLSKRKNRGEISSVVRATYNKFKDSFTPMPYEEFKKQEK